MGNFPPLGPRLEGGPEATARDPRPSSPAKPRTTRTLVSEFDSSAGRLRSGRARRGRAGPRARRRTRRSEFLSIAVLCSLPPPRPRWCIFFLLGLRAAAGGEHGGGARGPLGVPALRRPGAGASAEACELGVAAGEAGQQALQLTG